MQSSAEIVLGIHELLERIIMQLDCPHEIIRAQRVCRYWKAVIQNSPALPDACWYRHQSRDACGQSDGRQMWKLNPAFNRIGVQVTVDEYPTSLPAERQEHGNFNLQERIYDKPGSWTTMLATQPPCKQIEIECYSNYSMDETM